MNNLSLLLSVLVILFLIIPQNGVAQVNEIKSEDISTVFNTSGTIKTKSSTKTTGSPYLNDDFLKGHIVLNNNSKTGSLQLRFNIEKNNLEFIRDQEILIAEVNQLKAFKIYGQPSDITFKKGYNTNINGISEDTYLRTIYNDNLALLAQYRVNLIEDVPSYNSATTENKYNRSVSYYLVTSDGKFHELKSPKEDIFNLLSNKKKELQVYADSENLNFNEEDDLVEILKHYDSL